MRVFSVVVGILILAQVAFCAQLQQPIPAGQLVREVVYNELNDLGRLYKGGWFELQRAQVNSTEWKTVRLEVHICGRALLVKNFARDTSAARGGFAPVPAGMNLAQGMALLQQMEAHDQEPAHSGASLATSTALAIRR